MTGAAAEDQDGAQYSFERRSNELHLPQTTRSREDAADALDVLRLRLGIARDVKLLKDIEKLLLRYCTDTILNILWYDRARKREQRANAQRTYLMVALMAVALFLVVASAIPPFDRLTRSGTSVFPFAILAGGALTVMQVVASLGDGKARLAIFWKAGADLKESLYTFEEKWHGRVLQGSPPAIADGFEDAVHDELKQAHVVTRTERLEFFANLRSPSDVVAVAMSTVNGLQARRADSSATISAHNDRIEAAKKCVSEARAAVLASEFRLRSLDDPAAKKAEQAVLVAARAEVVRAEAILQDLTNG